MLFIERCSSITVLQDITAQNIYLQYWGNTEGKNESKTIFLFEDYGLMESIRNSIRKV